MPEHWQRLKKSELPHSPGHNEPVSSISGSVRSAVPFHRLFVKESPTEGLLKARARWRPSRLKHSRYGIRHLDLATAPQITVRPKQFNGQRSGQGAGREHSAARYAPPTWVSVHESPVVGCSNCADSDPLRPITARSTNTLRSTGPRPFQPLPHPRAAAPEADLPTAPASCRRRSGRRFRRTLPGRRPRMDASGLAAGRPRGPGRAG